MVTYTTPETAEEMQERIAQEERDHAEYRARKDAEAKRERDTFKNPSSEFFSLMFSE